MKNKVIAFIMIAMMAAGLLAGCGSNTSDLDQNVSGTESTAEKKSADTIQVEYWTAPNENQFEYWSAKAESYNQEKHQIDG